MTFLSKLIAMPMFQLFIENIYWLEIQQDIGLSKNIRPVIGILTQPWNSGVDNVNVSNIDSSYVRWLESGGAKVVPILFNDTTTNIEYQFSQLSGVLFTGGPNRPTDFDRYYKAATQLYDLSVTHKTPLWGTCLGFQMISDIVGGGDILSDYEAEDLELPLVLTPEASTSKLFANASSDIVDLFSKNSFTTNWHHYGVSPDMFNSKLAPNGMTMISTNVDANNLPFVSTMEHSEYPIYAVQWHPEANAFSHDHVVVDHSMLAVSAMQYMSNFFVNEARMKGIGPGDVEANVTDIEFYPLKHIPSSTKDHFKYVFE